MVKLFQTGKQGTKLFMMKKKKNLLGTVMIIKASVQNVGTSQSVRWCKLW